MSTTDSRTAFEVQEKRNSSNLKRDDTGQYENPCTQSAWEGWQAALAWQTEAAKATGTAGDLPPSARLSDGEINEITLESLGKWPSFEAQSWACKVVQAVKHKRHPEFEIGTIEGMRVYAKGYSAGEKKGLSEAARQPASVAQPADTARAAAAMRVEAVLATYDDCIRVISEMRLPHGQAASRNYYNTALFNAMEHLTKTRDGYRAATNRSQP